MFITKSNCLYCTNHSSLASLIVLGNVSENKKIVLGTSRTKTEMKKKTLHITLVSERVNSFNNSSGNNPDESKFRGVVRKTR